MRWIWMLLLCLPAACFGQDEYIQDTVVIRESNEPSFGPPPPEVDESRTYEENISFNTISQPKPVELKKLAPQTVEELKKEDDYWYADLEPKKPAPKKLKELPPPRQPVSTDWLRPLFWILMIGLVVGGVIWFLANRDVQLFGKPSKKIAPDDEVEEEEISDDIFAINYDKEIRRAEETANYRLAVRLHYLRTLRALADRGLIDYRYGKTNSDYVSALYGGSHYRRFFGLTRTFEYTWYGQFPLSSENYAAVAADFIAFKNGLGA